MKLILVRRNVMCGQCKNAPLRIQVGYTAFIVLPGSIKGWSGGQLGLFTPKKVGDEYRRIGFYFAPWLAPDVAVCTLPLWYRKLANALSFSI